MPSLYKAYLVRLWQEGEDAILRASVQSTQSDEIVYFANLGGLYAFLRAQANGEIASGAKSEWET